LLPELRRAREARAKLKHAILAVSLKKRIASLQQEESDSDSDEMGAAGDAIPGQKGASMLRDKFKDGAVFREVVMASVRDKKAKEEAAREEEAEKLARGES
jgi:calcium/calmodulin-dependent protein kinase I